MPVEAAEARRLFGVRLTSQLERRDVNVYNVGALYLDAVASASVLRMQWFNEQAAERCSSFSLFCQAAEVVLQQASSPDQVFDFFDAIYNGGPERAEQG